MTIGPTLLGVALAGSFLVGCSASGSPPGPAQTPMPTVGTRDPISIPAAASRTVEAPTWHPGDRWTYVWTSGSNRGSKTVEVREVKEVNGVRYYIVRNADADHYWTLDLHWAGSVRDSKVEARMVPPEPWYRWPLQLGQQWEHRGSYEQADGKRRAEDRFAVVGAEAVEVPAGTYQGFKIRRTGSGGDSDEYWYVPEVGSYVRWIGRRGGVEFEERLSEYRSGGPAPTPSAAPRVPSSAR